MNKVFQNVKFPKVIIRNKALKTIVNCYISEIDINDHYFLSSEFALLYLLLCYIISGILTVSDMGNALVVSITNIGLKMGNIDSKASRETDAVLTVYKYDLQLYKDMFLSAVIPLAIPQFVHALKQK